MGKTLMVGVRDLPDTSFFCSESLAGLKSVRFNPDKTRIYLIFTDHIEAKNALHAIKARFEGIFVKFMHYKVFFKNDILRQCEFSTDFIHGEFKANLRAYVEDNTDGHMVYPPTVNTTINAAGEKVFTGSGFIRVDTYDSMKLLIGDLSEKYKHFVFYPFMTPRHTPSAAATAEAMPAPHEEHRGRQRQKAPHRSQKAPRQKAPHRSQKAPRQHQQATCQTASDVQYSQMSHSQKLGYLNMQKNLLDQEFHAVTQDMLDTYTRAPPAPPTVSDYVDMEKMKQHDELTAEVMAAAAATAKAKAEESRTEWAARLAAAGEGVEESDHEDAEESEHEDAEESDHEDAEESDHEDAEESDHEDAEESDHEDAEASEHEDA
jgi:hypothetical protein